MEQYYALALLEQVPLSSDSGSLDDFDSGSDLGKLSYFTDSSLDF